MGSGRDDGPSLDAILRDAVATDDRALAAQTLLARAGERLRAGEWLEAGDDAHAAREAALDIVDPVTYTIALPCHLRSRRQAR